MNNEEAIVSKEEQIEYIQGKIYDILKHTFKIENLLELIMLEWKIPTYAPNVTRLWPAQL